MGIGDPGISATPDSIHLGIAPDIFSGTDPAENPSRVISLDSYLGRFLSGTVSLDAN